MGVLRSTQSMEAEVEEMRAALLLTGAGACWRAAKRAARAQEGAAEARTVCVTGGTSFLGFAVVDRLLRHGYNVRLALETQEDLDKLREMEMFGENGRDGIWTVMANVMDPQSLHEAFDGCVGVFHTSSLVDPGGISGYTLWFALGKTMAEKAAWRAARGTDLKLVTVCPALVTGPGFRRRNPTPSIAYLKGAQAMLGDGLLATADLEKVAEAHVRVYEAMMSDTAGGRYICYDHVVRRPEEFAELQRQLGLRAGGRVLVSDDDDDRAARFQLCNRKLAALMSARRRCTYDAYFSVPYE
ncbi:hypothetical protein PR202_gb02213 [Eleusine coracana subsp. coracana]|uniref:NAD-dependent epimerase/dehydratase domain-containing protein n=1 Tax=Eleusine coracana subsp. coracana TaxID=191504 RepID=A0AAV5DYR5_ELECO|nr:hypothetical protein PR202_gb02213 [Eleusine coracana subsp. coracana]